MQGEGVKDLLNRHDRGSDSESAARSLIPHITSTHTTLLITQLNRIQLQIIMRHKKGLFI